MSDASDKRIIELIKRIEQDVMARRHAAPGGDYAATLRDSIERSQDELAGLLTARREPFVYQGMKYVARGNKVHLTLP